MEFDLAVFIGRFQPPHIEHLKEIQRSLEIAHNVCVVIGSHRGARTPKNPFTSEEREQMLRNCLSSEENQRIFCVKVRDSFLQ